MLCIIWIYHSKQSSHFQQVSKWWKTISLQCICIFSTKKERKKKQWCKIAIAYRNKFGFSKKKKNEKKKFLIVCYILHHFVVNACCLQQAYMLKSSQTFQRFTLIFCLVTIVIRTERTPVPVTIVRGCFSPHLLGDFLSISVAYLKQAKGNLPNEGIRTAIQAWQKFCIWN